MEAAVSLKKKGHNVDLYEKDSLGGQFNLAHLPPKKDSLKNILTYYFDEVRRTEVNVIEKEADKQMLSGGKYDTVVLATGAVPAIPPIEGLKDYFWAEMLEEHNLPEGQKVIVIGGGLIGLEIAHALVHKGNQVIIVEMLGDLARDMEMIERKLTLKTIKEKNTEIYLNTKVTRIDKDTCYLEGETTKEINGIDRVIVATGMKSYNPLQKEIENDVETYVIGDANTPGKAMNAIRDAFYLAQKI